MPAELLIGADVVPTSKNVGSFSKGDALALVGQDLLDVLNHADYRICNMEAPLTDKEDPIDKCGPNLIAPSSAINGYKAMGIDFVTLANNHILDQGEQGLVSTIELLKQNGIAYCGAGKNLEEAQKPFVFEFDGKKVGVYACVEHEFTCATDSLPGANPYDPLESFDDVLKLKSKVDYLIVLYHGGKEHYRYPSPNLQRRCRKFVEKGANLVICQHSHIIGAKEEYKDGTIVYGQGNFLFDMGDDEGSKTSLLIKLDEEFKVTYIPLVKDGNGVTLAKGDTAKKILDNFENRSEEIKQDGIVESKYEEFASSMVDSYLLTVSGKRRSFFFRVINKLSGYRYMKWWARHKFRKQNLLGVENYINCEAHRELFLRGVFGRRSK